MPSNVLTLKRTKYSLGVCVELDRRQRRGARITFRCSDAIKRAMVERARLEQTTVGKLIVNTMVEYIQSDIRQTSGRRSRGAA